MSKRFFYIAMSIVSVILSSQANAAFIRSENVKYVEDVDLIEDDSFATSTSIRPYGGIWYNTRAVKDGDSVIAEFNAGCRAVRGCGANITASALLNYRILLDFIDKDAFFESFDDPFYRLNVGVNYSLSLFAAFSRNPVSTGIIEGPQIRPQDRRHRSKITVKGNHSNQFNPISASIGSLSSNVSESRSDVLYAVVDPRSEQMYIDITLEAFVRGGVGGNASNTQNLFLQAISDPYISLPEEYVDFLQVTNTSFTLAGEFNSFGTPPNTVPSPSTISILSLLVPFLILRKNLKLKNAA